MRVRDFILGVILCVGLCGCVDDKEKDYKEKFKNLTGWPASRQIDVSLGLGEEDKKEIPIIKDGVVQKEWLENSTELFSINSWNQLVYLSYNSEFLTKSIIFNLKSLNPDELDVEGSDEQPLLLDQLQDYSKKIVEQVSTIGPFPVKNLTQKYKKGDKLTQGREYVTFLCKSSGRFKVKGSIYLFFLQNEPESHLVFYFEYQCQIVPRNPNILVEVSQLEMTGNQSRRETIQDKGIVQKSVYEASENEVLILIKLIKGNQFITSLELKKLTSSPNQARLKGHSVNGGFIEYSKKLEVHVFFECSVAAEDKWEFSAFTPPSTEAILFTLENKCQKIQQATPNITLNKSEGNISSLPSEMPIDVGTSSGGFDVIKWGETQKSWDVSQSLKVLGQEQDHIVFYVQNRFYKQKLIKLAPPVLTYQQNIANLRDFYTHFPKEQDQIGQLDIQFICLKEGTLYTEVDLIFIIPDNDYKKKLSFQFSKQCGPRSYKMHQDDEADLSFSSFFFYLGCLVIMYSGYKIVRCLVGQIQNEDKVLPKQSKTRDQIIQDEEVELKAH